MTTVAASVHRLRSWAVAVALLLSTLAAGVPPTSMEWPGSQASCADVAVTVAVNPDHIPTADQLDYRITAGHSHGPPTSINDPATNGHTYYVLAGDTPVLVHNDGELPGNTRQVFNIAPGYSGRIDRFNYGGQAHFEIHVFRGQTEVGIFGSNGWIGKHGHPADMELWRTVENRLKGVAIAEMQRSGRLPLGADVSGDAWKRPHVSGGC